MSSRLGEGLWEAKFILPEHHEAMSQRRLEEKRKVQPALDDQELELIQQALAESYNEHREITIRLWGEYEDKVVTGIVTAVQTYRGEEKVSTYENDWEWVRIKDIVAAE